MESLTKVSYFNDSRVNATISTYRDCCKVSCGWPNKASVTSPPETCAQDGVTAIKVILNQFVTVVVHTYALINNLEVSIIVFRMVMQLLLLL